MRCLQESGKRVTVYFEEDSLKKKMNYANKIGASNVILIGEEEIEKNEVKIKNMNSGESKDVDYKLL
ncbi:histidyl-tRNA ligase HisS [Clostridium baratii]|nr:histidyl-tRNA ligase HisS [Clostridium baratii]